MSLPSHICPTCGGNMSNTEAQGVAHQCSEQVRALAKELRDLRACMNMDPDVGARMMNALYMNRPLREWLAEHETMSKALERIAKFETPGSLVHHATDIARAALAKVPK